MKQLAATLFYIAALSAPVHASSDAVTNAIPEPLSAVSNCRTLMTELECSLHKTTLAQLNPGPTRDRYLAEYAQMMQERESLCSCNRKVSAGTVYPTRRQALLSF